MSKTAIGIHSCNQILQEFNYPYLTESQCHTATQRSIVVLGRKRNEIVREETKEDSQKLMLYRLVLHSFVGLE